MTQNYKASIGQALEEVIQTSTELPHICPVQLLIQGHIRQSQDWNPGLLANSELSFLYTKYMGGGVGRCNERKDISPHFSESSEVNLIFGFRNMLQFFIAVSVFCKQDVHLILQAVVEKSFRLIHTESSFISGLIISRSMVMMLPFAPLLSTLMCLPILI